MSTGRLTVSVPVTATLVTTVDVDVDPDEYRAWLHGYPDTPERRREFIRAGRAFDVANLPLPSSFDTWNVDCVEVSP